MKAKTKNPVRFELTIVNGERFAKQLYIDRNPRPIKIDKIGVPCMKEMINNAFDFMEFLEEDTMIIEL